MTYGTKVYKNGKIVGYLEFGSGKKVFLNHSERQEFERKINYWNSLIKYLYEAEQIKVSRKS